MGLLDVARLGRFRASPAELCRRLVPVVVHQLHNATHNGNNLAPPPDRAKIANSTGLLEMPRPTAPQACTVASSELARFGFVRSSGTTWICVGKQRRHHRKRNSSWRTPISISAFARQLPP